MILQAQRPGRRRIVSQECPEQQKNKNPKASKHKIQTSWNKDSEGEQKKHSGNIREAI